MRHDVPWLDYSVDTFLTDVGTFMIADIEL